MQTGWNPSTYLQFADERGRPFFDLAARIAAENPKHVVDLGCGPGQLTATLANRWPGAMITGIDSSPEMIKSAAQQAGPRVGFEIADLRQWQPAEPVDVLVSNAALQWVPDHREVLPRLLDTVAPGGWFAFQVPGNFAEPSHRLLHALAKDPRFAKATRGLERAAAFGAADYLADLTALGCAVEAWETSYLHILTGPDPVFRWISGTGARPILEALDEDQRAEFVAEYKQSLNAAYPAQPFGTVLPFRRIFVVAHKIGD